MYLALIFELWDPDGQGLSEKEKKISVQDKY